MATDGTKCATDGAKCATDGTKCAKTVCDHAPHRKYQTSFMATSEIVKEVSLAPSMLGFQVIIIIIMGLESVSASEDVIGDLPSP